jgi:sugar diacid utilization regulator
LTTISWSQRIIDIGLNIDATGFRVVVIHIPCSESNEFGNNQYKTLKHLQIIIIRYIEQLLNTTVTNIFYESNKIALIFNCGKCNSSEEKTYTDIFIKLVDLIKEKYHTDIHIGVGNQVSDISQICYSFSEAKAAEYYGKIKNISISFYYYSEKYMNIDNFILYMTMAEAFAMPSFYEKYMR